VGIEQVEEMMEEAVSWDRAEEAESRDRAGRRDDERGGK
jgi:hypothetical protein